MNREDLIQILNRERERTLILVNTPTIDKFNLCYSLGIEEKDLEIEVLQPAFLYSDEFQGRVNNYERVLFTSHQKLPNYNQDQDRLICPSRPDVHEVHISEFFRFNHGESIDTLFLTALNPYDLSREWRLLERIGDYVSIHKKNTNASEELYFWLQRSLDKFDKLRT